MTKAPENYRPMQIVLHWVVVLGILLQWTFNEQIARVANAQQRGFDAPEGDLTMALLHVGIGSAIFLAVLGRLYLRYRYGVPDHAPGTSKIQSAIATWMHRALYAVLIAMVVTGGLTWNGVAALGGVHFGLNTVLFVLALAHAAAALFNHYVRKDGTLKRMALTRFS